PRRLTGRVRLVRVRRGRPARLAHPTPLLLASLSPRIAGSRTPERLLSAGAEAGGPSGQSLGALRLMQVVEGRVDAVAVDDREPQLPGRPLDRLPPVRLLLLSHGDHLSAALCSLFVAARRPDAYRAAVAAVS